MNDTPERTADADGTRRALMLMLLAASGFSAMAICVGVAHRVEPQMPTIVASFVRSVVNLVALVVLAWPTPGTLWGDRRPELWLRGVFGAVSLTAYFASLAAVGVGEAAFLNATSAFWVAALAPFVLRERTRPMTWVAVAGSLVGMALLTHPRADAGESVARGIGLLSGLTSAAAYLSVRRASSTNAPRVIVFYFTIVATVVTGVWMVVTRAAFPRSPWVIVALSLAGLAATASQLAMTEAYRIGRAAPVAASGATSPLLSAVLGWLVLDEVPDRTAAIGMGVLFLASVLLPFLS